MNVTGRSLTDRMKGAAMLDVATYEDVEADESATGQAAAVVAMAAVASAIGAIGTGTAGVLGALLSYFFGWLLWSGVTYLIGDKLLGGTATWGELLRTLGFALSPGILLVFGFIPFIGWLIGIIVGFWILVAGVIAIRQALDFSTGKAVATAFLGWLTVAILSVVFRL